jgi:hypothetical protein
MEALRYVGTFRFLTPAQVEEFVLGASMLTAGSREVVTRRILRRLRTRQLVTTNALLAGEPDGMPTRIAYFLTSSGRRLFAALEPDLPRWRPRVQGTFLLAHALMVAEIALAFRRHARANPTDVLTWECDWQVVESLGRLPVVPDARITYETGRQRIHAFIEADRGSERTRYFGRKIQRYIDLYLGGQWRERLPVWPLVLTVVPTEARARELRRASETVLEARPAASRVSRAFRFTSLDALRGMTGPFGEIWHVAGRSGLFPFIDEPTTAAAGPTDASAATVPTSPPSPTPESERDGTAQQPA